MKVEQLIEQLRALPAGTDVVALTDSEIASGEVHQIESVKHLVAKDNGGYEEVVGDMKRPGYTFVALDCRLEASQPIAGTPGNHEKKGAALKGAVSVKREHMNQTVLDFAEKYRRYQTSVNDYDVWFEFENYDDALKFATALQGRGIPCNAQSITPPPVFS